MTRDPYASLKQGLVGCWIPSISGSGLLLPDLSMRGNNGVLTNMDASDWVGSGTGRALDFDGVNDKVTLSMQNIASLTASCWVYSRNINNANGEYFVVKWGPNPSVNANDFYIGAFANNWIARTGDGSTGQSTLLQTPATANQWTHLLVTRDTANLKLFVNGIEMTSTSAASFQGGGSRPLELCDLAGFPANCQLDDIRVYNRILTESEIRLLASDRGIGFKPNKKLSRFSTRYTYQPPKAKVFEGVRVRDHDYSSLRHGLVGGWCPSLPNGGSGSILPDQSGRGNSGTLVGMGPEDWVASGTGRALDIFDDQYVDCTTMSALSLAYPFSMACWVYNMTSNNIDFSPFAKTRQVGTYQGPMIYFASATNATAIAYWAGGTGATGASGVTQLTNWTHIGICWTGNQARVYVNGRLDGTGNTTTAPNASTASVNIGRYNSEGFGQRSMRGLVDDCRIYDRCLTDSEWALLASKRGIGLQPSPTRFIAKEKKTGLRRRILTGQP